MRTLLTWRHRHASMVLSAIAVAALAATFFTDGLSAMSAGQQRPDGSERPPSPFAGDRAAITEGSDLFGRNCQQCHSTRGIGGKCPQLIHGAWGPGGANSDALMYRIIAEGRPNTQMGAFKDALTDEEIWKIIAYLRYEARRYEEQEKSKEEESSTRR